MTRTKNILRVGVIMAGGSGERFWPLSRWNRPKQLLALTHPHISMLSQSRALLGGIIRQEHIYIITGRHLVTPICGEETSFPPDHILAEPSKRNTAGALAYAAAWLMARYADHQPDAITMAVTTADHRIGEPDCFSHMVDTALNAAEREDALVTCGIRPTRPETGFGYIEVVDDTPIMTGTGGTPPVYKVRAFHEKPDAVLAARFLAGGRHYWNSGMFFWKLSTFLEELKRAQPTLAEAVVAMTKALKKDDAAEVDCIFDAIESISIDYALMEKSENVLVVRGDFPWADVGSWNAVSFAAECDAAGNHTVGTPVLIDCAECVVYNETGGDKMAVGVVGMSDTIVVVTADAVLVMPKSRAQDVRAVVEELKRRGAPQL